MNCWLRNSIDYANKKSYLDDLSCVYPIKQGYKRKIDEEKWNAVEKAFKEKDKVQFLEALIELEKFPIKDGYVAYLRRDRSALERNPKTVDRIYNRLYPLGLDKLKELCCEPKEANRQMGSKFKEWVRGGALGIRSVSLKEFQSTTEDSVLDAGDKKMKDFAHEKLNYTRDKGLDFVARIKGRYVIGEAKFISAVGGNQNNQFRDAIGTYEAIVKDKIKAMPLAIVDGVPYIESDNEMHKALKGKYKEYNIMSVLVLRDFLNSIR